MDADKYVFEIAAQLRKMARQPRGVQFEFRTKGEATLLLFLSLRGNHASPGELAEDAGVTTARVAAALKQAERKGWIVRSVDTEDRRKVLVTMTAAGETYVKERIVKLVSCWKRMLEALGEEDAQALVRILKTLDILIGEQEEAPPDAELAERVYSYLRETSSQALS